MWTQNIGDTIVVKKNKQTNIIDRTGNIPLVDAVI